MEIWRRTLLLRLLRKNVSNHVTHPCYENVLQQMWMSDNGKKEWRDIDVVFDK